MKKTLGQTAFLAWTLSLIVACNQEQKKEETQTSPETAAADSLKASQERGKYLAMNVVSCIDCHSVRDFNRYSGPPVAGTEGRGGERFGPEMGLPGEVFAKNISPTALKDWTDEELLKVITHGVNKKGDTLFPLMPYMSYSRMHKQDALDIIAYIRTLAPQPDSVPARKLFIPIAAAVPQLPPPSLDANVKPDPSDTAAYGGYLFTIAACSDCHTPMEKGAPDFARMGAGGRKFITPQFTVVSANITSDPETGIGSWTEEMFLTKFKDSKQKSLSPENPGKTNTLMPWSLYADMKESDLKAIYAFVKTLKPVKNKVEKWPTQ